MDENTSKRKETLKLLLSEKDHLFCFTYFKFLEISCHLYITVGGHILLLYYPLFYDNQSLTYIYFQVNICCREMVKRYKDAN